MTQDTKEVRYTMRSPEELIAKVDRIADKAGISRNAQINLLVSEGIDAIQTPKLKYYLIVADKYVVIYDAEIFRQVLVTIDQKKRTLYCDFDLTTDCRHAEFAKRIPFVHDVLASRT